MCILYQNLKIPSFSTKFTHWHAEIEKSEFKVLITNLKNRYWEWHILTIIPEDT